MVVKAIDSRPLPNVPTREALCHAAHYSSCRFTYTTALRGGASTI